MESVEANVGNTKQPIHDGIQTNNIYHLELDYDSDDDDVVILYDQEIKDQHIEGVDEAYVEDMDEYIGTHIVLPGKYYIPVLTNIRGRKGYHSCDLVGETNNNPILGTRIYKLEFSDGRVEEYSVNNILENLLEIFDSDG